VFSFFSTDGVSVKKLVEVSWESGKNRDTMTPPRLIEKLLLFRISILNYTLIVEGDLSIFGSYV
jgi:hypothetical protein